MARQSATTARLRRPNHGIGTSPRRMDDSISSSTLGEKLAKRFTLIERVREPLRLVRDEERVVLAGLGGGESEGEVDLAGAHGLVGVDALVADHEVALFAAAAGERAFGVQRIEEGLDLGARQHPGGLRHCARTASSACRARCWS